MAEGRARSRKLAGAGKSGRVTGAEELFTFPWPGPGNSEGPVDPDPWSQVENRDDPLGSGPSASILLTTAPWPGPGDSEA
jgi:hypothetical protein